MAEKSEQGLQGPHQGDVALKCGDKSHEKESDLQQIQESVIR